MTSAREARPPMPRAFIAVIILACAAMLAAAVAFVIHERDRAIEEAKAGNLTLARILSRQLFHVVRTSDIVLEHTLADIALLGIEGAATALDNVQPLLARSEEVGTMAVYDAAGRLVAATDGGLDGFPVLPVSGESPGFEVAAPEGDPQTGTPAIVGSRPILGADGSVLGMIRLRIDAGYFERLFDTLRADSQHAVAVFRTDGLLVARRPADGVGKRFASAEVFERLRDAPEGTWEPVSRIDQLPRISAYAAVTGYPLVIVVSQTRESVLVPWYALALRIGLITGAALAMLLIFAGQVSAAIRRERAALGRAENTAGRLSAVVEAAPVGICGLDGDGRIRFANQMAAQLTGYGPDELLDADMHALLHHSSPDGTPMPLEDCHMQRILREGGVASVVDEVFWSKAGRSIAVEYIAAAMPWTSGDRGAVIIFRDLTEKLRMERELLRSNAELKQFAYAASHDLRSPLRAIENLATWIEEDLRDRADGELRENLGLLRRRVSRLDRLLDALLEYANVGRQEAMETVDTGQVVEQLAAALPAGFTLTASALPLITAPREPVELVFRNLIDNAVKHHDRSEGHVAVSACDLGARIEFCVSDDGPGIPEAYRDKVFGLFQTLKPKDEVEGSGIGLSIARKAVERYGGTMTIGHGPDGRGTTVRFTWPKMA